MRPNEKLFEEHCIGKYSKGNESLKSWAWDGFLAACELKDKEINELQNKIKDLEIYKSDWSYREMKEALLSLVKITTHYESGAKKFITDEGYKWFDKYNDLLKRIRTEGVKDL